MKKSLTACLLSVFISYSFNCTGQINTYILGDVFTWSSWEEITENDKKVKFLTESVSGVDDDFLKSNVDDYKIIDIDADGLLDVIYLNSTSNSYKTTFYLNKSNTLEISFQSFECLISINRRKPWSPIGFQTSQDIDQTGKLIKTYVPGLIDNKLTFITESSVLIHNQLKLIYENIPPMLFEVLNDIELRWSPDEIPENIIKHYNQFEKGYAIASAGDNSSKSWWLVLIKENDHTYRTGWLPREDLKPLIASNQKYID